ELPPIRQARRLGAWIGRQDERVDLQAVWGWTWTRRRMILSWAAGLLLLAYATSGWTAVGPSELGVLQRLGRYQATLGPGLRLRWRGRIERATAVARERVRSLEIGFRAARRPDAETVGWESSHGRGLGDPAEDAALLLTGDGRYVELAATLEYAIDREDSDSLRRFIFEVDAAEAAVRSLAESP